MPPMRIYLFSLIAFIALSAHGVTVDVETSIKQRMSLAKPLPYAGVEYLFKNSPQFNYECVLDTAVSSHASEEAAAMLGLYVPVSPEGFIQFSYEPTREKAERV